MQSVDEGSEKIAKEFPGWRIWRGRTNGVPCGSWIATKIDPEAGVDATVIRDSAGALVQALGEQREAVARGARTVNPRSL